MEMAMEMMIPMKSSLMTLTMVMISPLREGISTTDCSLPESFSLSRVSAPWRRQNFSWMIMYVLGLWGMKYMKGGLPWWARAATQRGGALGGVPAPPHGVGP